MLGGGNDVMPDWVRNSTMGVGKCLCGHVEAVYHFEIQNTEMEILNVLVATTLTHI